MFIGPQSISNFPAVKFDGEYRVLACIPSDDNHDFGDWNEYFGNIQGADTFQLREIDFSWLHNRILNQGQTSSCVGHCAAEGMEIVWRQAGHEPQLFTPYFTYAQINNGRDAGAMISNALMSLKRDGGCPANLLEDKVYYKNNLPQQAVQAAQRFKIFKGLQCSSFDAICQAINLGFGTPLGIMVGQNFPKLDSDGIAPLPNGGGGGHCLLGVGLKQHQRYGWLIKVQNSWGEKYGLKGFCYLHKGHFQYMQIDAFAIQAVFDDPQDSTPNDEVPTVISN